jgi:hypothetical protein
MAAVATTSDSSLGTGEVVIVQNDSDPTVESNQSPTMIIDQALAKKNYVQKVENNFQKTSETIEQNVQKIPIQDKLSNSAFPLVETKTHQDIVTVTTRPKQKLTEMKLTEMKSTEMKSTETKNIRAQDLSSNSQDIITVSKQPRVNSISTLGKSREKPRMNNLNHYQWLFSGCC